MEEINKYKKLVEEIENYIKEINKEYNEIKAKSYGVKIEDSYCEELRKEFFKNAGKYEAYSYIRGKIQDIEEEQ